MYLQRLKTKWFSEWNVKLASVYLLLLLLCVLFAPVFTSGTSPNNLDLTQPYLKPFTSLHHWLGTDQLGRDIWINLLHGCRTAFLIAIPVSAASFLAGTTLGMAAAWFGNKKLKIKYAAILCFPVWLCAIWFYVFYQNNQQIPLRLAWLTGISISIWLLYRFLKTLRFLSKKVTFPLDEVLLKTIELLSSVPRLILILTFAALLPPGIFNVILLLSLTFWTSPARLARAETLKLKQLPYIEAATASGLSIPRILFRQILPNAAPPLITAFCFGLSSLLGLEATLSFLGIGLPPETPSWGRMLAGARLNPDAWWLILFPASFLYITILAIQTIGNAYRKD